MTCLRISSDEVPVCSCTDAMSSFMNPMLSRCIGITFICISILSENGPASRRLCASSCLRLQVHTRLSSHRYPHLHGFAAATIIVFDGNIISSILRLILTNPSSTGCLMASIAFESNSPSSSRNSTPPWASDSSPGRGFVPPPVRPTADIVW